MRSAPQSAAGGPRAKAASVDEYVSRLLAVLDRITRTDGVIDAAAAAELAALASSLDEAARGKADARVRASLEVLAKEAERVGKRQLARAALLRLQVAAMDGLSKPTFTAVPNLLDAVSKVIARAEGSTIEPSAVLVPLAVFEALKAAAQGVGGA